MEAGLVNELDAMTCCLHASNLFFFSPKAPYFHAGLRPRTRRSVLDWLTQPDTFLAPRSRAIFARSALT